MEHRVHGGQADVFIASAVTGDEVPFEQFVVVGARGLHANAEDADGCVQVGGFLDLWRCGVVVVVKGVGCGVVRDVVQERVAGTDGVGGQENTLAAVRSGVAFNQPGGGDDLHEAVRAADEFAIAVGREQGAIEDVGVLQAHAQHAGGLRLHIAPGAFAGGGGDQTRSDLVPQQAARRHDIQCGSRIWGADGVVGHTRVFAQEHLVRGVRGVGLVLVDERGRGVAVVVNVVGSADDAVQARLVGSAGQHHEVGRAANDEQRVVRLQGDEHGAAAALVDQVQAVVEELAEECHPAVERGRQANVGRQVGNHERRTRRHARAGDVHDGRVVTQHAVAFEVGLYGRRVVGRLVDDEVGNDAGLRVEHQARVLGIAGGRKRRWARAVRVAGFGSPQLNGNVTRHQVVGCAQALLAGQQVVPGAVDRAQAIGQQGCCGSLRANATDGVAQRGAIDLPVRQRADFGNLDLLEDEIQVLTVDVEVVLRCRSHLKLPICC